jgi:phosphatidylglycerophosphatase C
MANLNKPVIAAFDFDGTLTHRDSLLPFLCYVAGPLTTCKNLWLETPCMIGFLLGWGSRQSVKEALLTRFFRGMSNKVFLGHAERYATQYLPKMVTKKGLERIKWHQKQGDRCIIVSANLEAYLSFWGQAAGFDDVVATRIETVDDKITGKLLGLNCRGAEKVRRLEQLMGPLDQFIIYAYGDSKGDKELLAIADHAFYRTLV